MVCRECDTIADIFFHEVFDIVRWDYAHLLSIEDNYNAAHSFKSKKFIHPMRVISIIDGSLVQK